MKTIKNLVTVAAIVVAGNVGTISAQEFKDYENRVLVNKEIGKANPFGKESILLVENFATLETGSEETPSKINEDDLPDWGLTNVYSGGGKIYLLPNSRITTPDFPRLKAGENVWFRFKAKSEKNSKIYIKIEGTGKDKESIKGDVILSTLVKDEWEEYYSFFYDGVVDSKISIYLDEKSSPTYIDDLEIFTVDQYVGTPVMLPHSNYDGKSFIANWTKPDGAIGYRINVFTIDSKYERNTGITSKIKDYLVKDRFTSNNFFLVEDIDPDKIYYYTVTAYNDTTRSILSKRMGVVDIVSPKIEENSVNISDGSIRLKWSHLEGAAAYEYSLLKKKVFERDEEVVVVSEDMNDLKSYYIVSRKDIGDHLSKYTGDDFNSRFYYFRRYGKKGYSDAYYSGWKATYCVNYKEGYLGLNNLEYIRKSTKETARIISPELDLSKDGGRFRLSVKLQSASMEHDGSITDSRTQARFILKNYNESALRYEISEIIYTKDVKDYWKTFEINFSKGTSKSIVEIEVIDSIGVNLYVDDIKITQYYKKGDTSYILVRGALKNENEVILSIDTSDTSEFIQRISSIREINTEEQYLVGKDLVTSNSYEVSTKIITNGIDNLQQPEFSVEVKNNTVYISNTGTYRVNVFTLDGKSVYSGANKDSHCVNLPSNTYIIHVGNKSIKLKF